MGELLISGAAKAAFDINEAVKDVKGHRQVFENAENNHINGAFLP